ncbi:RNA polymerase sigma factor [Enhygromyxa salina]|uniref:ECF RNA polymerase sigma-E factor n=1 Tax=Enhygromyxa salina TaxID=215803 RepID=A0A2S9XNQ7_9BACT|nr:RNA polymerase sigma factor [Enhygromyxa salina]PRP94321.1 ECF RNA polymerase sigma-E factor [Enhygromyxa salina]
MVSDDELLAAWRAGDRRAGSTLFGRHYETVRRFFVNKVDTDLEDIIQRTFEACAQGQERFEGRSSFLAYLRGIARHLLLQHWESRRHRDRDVPVDELSLADLGAGASSVLARNRAEKRLLDALRQIRLKDQELLELYYWEGLSGPALAEVLAIPEDTVRSRLRRAKLALKKEYLRLERFAGVPESSDQDLEGWARSLRERLNVVEPAG